MKEWTLEKAKNSFSEVVRRALAHEPQLVTRGGREGESVVVVARADYERLLAPVETTRFFAESPLAKAVAEGSFGDPKRPTIAVRARGGGRPVDLK